MEVKNGQDIASDHNRVPIPSIDCMFGNAAQQTTSRLKD
jgi:hypothetical protein